jgi:hypothetical protein
MRAAKVQILRQLTDLPRNLKQRSDIPAFNHSCVHECIRKDDDEPDTLHLRRDCGILRTPENIFFRATSEFHLKNTGAAANARCASDLFFASLHPGSGT